MSLVADAIVEGILRAEGGASNHPHDSGGLTNYGITLPWLSDRLGREATPAELLTLTREQAKNHYLDWLNTTRLIALCQYAEDEPMAACVIDWAVQTNPIKGVKLLQTALGFTGADVDGILGSQTLVAYDGVRDRQAVVTAMVKARIHHRVMAVTHDVTQLDFLNGWIQRDVSFL